MTEASQMLLVERQSSIPRPRHQSPPVLGVGILLSPYIPTFADVSAPLRTLIKKNAAFVWTETSQAAFCELKHLLTTAPVLAYPRFDPSQSFTLETDASGVSLVPRPFFFPNC